MYFIATVCRKCHGIARAHFQQLYPYDTCVSRVPAHRERGANVIIISKPPAAFNTVYLQRAPHCVSAEAHECISIIRLHNFPLQHTHTHSPRTGGALLSPNYTHPPFCVPYKLADRAGAFTLTHTHTHSPFTPHKARKS